MTFLDPFFWLNLIYFFIAIFLAFFIPGDIFVKRLGLSNFQRIIIATVFGMVLWAIQGFIFGYLQIRWFSYVYLFFCLFIWFKKNGLRQGIDWKRYLQYRYIDWLLVFIFILGVSIQFISVGFNGISYDNSLHFCCNLPDSLYHIALVHALIANVPPYEPGMYDVVVKNYHYLSNLSVAELIRVFRLPLLYTQNQYITILLSFLIGLSAMVFAQTLRLGKTYIRWLIFFLYFYGDIIFLISFLLGKGIRFDYTLQENAATLWTSPPRVFALVIFFIGLSLLSLWIEKRKMYIGMLMAIVMGSLIGFKVYIGIFALSGLGFLGLYYLLKRDMKMLIPLVAAVIISACLYLPTNSSSGGLFFSGFWRLEDFIVNPAYDLSRLELARRIYLEHASYLRIAQYEIMYMLLYIPSIFGIFLLGFFQTKKSLSLIPTQVHIYLLSGLLMSLLLGIFFLQHVGGANTSQFIFPLYIVGAIYTALICAVFINPIKNPGKIIIIIGIVFLTIIRVLYTTNTNLFYIARNESVIVNQDELGALRYLDRNVPKSSVLLIGNKEKIISNGTYYMSFMTDIPLFLAGSGILNDHGVNTAKKFKAIDTILFHKSPSKVGKTLLDNSIDYLYMKDGSYLISTNSAYFLRPILINRTITILKVEKESVKKYIKKYKSKKLDY